MSTHTETTHPRGSFRRLCAVATAILGLTIAAAVAGQMLIAQRVAEGSFVTAVPLPANLDPNMYVFGGSALYGFNYRKVKDVYAGDQVLLPPFQQLRPGVWFMDRGATGHWTASYMASAVGDGHLEAIVDGRPRSFPFEDVELFSDSEPLTHFPRLLFTSVVALVFIGCVAGVFRRASGALKDYQAQPPRDEALASDMGSLGKVPGVLRCPNCGALVPLVDTETTACTYCQTRVAVPEVVRQFMRSNAHMYAQAEAELRELRAEKRFDLVFGVGALALGLVPIVALPRVSEGAFSMVAQAMAGLGWMIWIFIGPLVALGGLVFVVSGLLLEGVRRDFEAVPLDAGRGFECRVCGAPLAPRPIGMTQPCLHCSAQNIIPAVLRTATQRARSTALGIAVALHERRVALYDRVLMVAWPIVSWGAPLAAILGMVVLLLALIMI